jgi:3-deoxy-D-manno-octulosonic-acid transferase
VIGRGGQNPIEPAKLGAALLHGPAVANFADIYAALDAEGGARLVQDADDLAAALADLFGHPGRLRDMARAAAQVVERRTGAVERTLQALIPQLAALKP